ncbi:sigma-B regulation protein RsbQ [Microbacteriaceae bacterium SG_E_30_P1]|uniref:Sigma-B regulation protein RsbQ n=1 Tax=Antiquaquibacter oligotrophicus TaxID=2880260 RepID=A0ABT6KKB0_9MICO|nr:alpha/beta hydrolase [Antiquaquibacter oligotrophicus]MDH6180130.1 sigma-B regulation protein RsbQ [Antiquaquibacter oligotrophicus]UDF14119.1 alpha/beta hydrolase [Antiquaquibacter oligotrophicus]
MDPLKRNNVRVTGNTDGTTLVLIHGFGSTRETWRYVAEALEPHFRVVVFDQVGVGGSDKSVYDRSKYDTLHGYADDVIEIVEALALTDVVLVGHSIGAMTAVLAANARPDLVSKLVLIAPSPRYLDDEGYRGGFSRQAIDDLLTSLETNYLSFSQSLAPIIVGMPDRLELSADFAEGIYAIDPEINSQFARVTFRADHRRDLRDVTVPALVLQIAEDAVAGPEVGAYVHRSIPTSTMVTIPSRGHVPLLSDPDLVAQSIKDYLR